VHVSHTNRFIHDQVQTLTKTYIYGQPLQT